MRKIGLAGYYGMCNYGDDLFLEVAKAAVRKYWSEYVPLVIDGPSRPASRVSAGTTMRKLVELGRKVGKAATTDRLVLAGGSLYHDASSKQLRIVEKVMALRGRRTSAIGVSIGPLRSVGQERGVAARLKKLEYLAVRDAASLCIAEELALPGKCVHAGDLAFLYPLVRVMPQENRMREERVVGFSPCFLSDEMVARRQCDRFVSALMRARSTMEVSALVLCLNEHPILGDRRLCEYTAARLESSGIPFTAAFYGDLGLAGTWDLIASLTAYVSVRLHGAVTASAAGTPFILVEYHRKCSDFLDEIGYPSRLRWRADGALALGELLDGGLAVSVKAVTDRAVRNFTEAPWLTSEAVT